MEQYADKLSEATKELLKRYPTFRLDVYPTRRPANYSAWFVENTRKNAAGRCKAIENGEAVTGCFGGTPFPVPKTGQEAMWNLMLTNKGASSWTYGQAWYVDGGGNKVMTAEVNNRNQNDYFNQKLTAEEFYAKGGQYFMNNNIYTAPARITGEGNLQRKFINPVAQPDKTWAYTPGQRRVRLSPDASYDFPVATAAGAMLYDEIYAFSGRLDRFDWKLVGTKEMLIPYNNYKYLAGQARRHPDEGPPEPGRDALGAAPRHRGRRHAQARRAPRGRQAPLLLGRGHPRRGGDRRLGRHRQALARHPEPDGLGLRQAGGGAGRHLLLRLRHRRLVQLVDPRRLQGPVHRTSTRSMPTPSTAPKAWHAGPSAECTRAWPRVHRSPLAPCGT